MSGKDYDFHLNNMPVTILRTKSDNELFVTGGNSKNQRLHYGSIFLKNYNRNFTHQEQMKIGNVIYYLNDKLDNTTAGRAYFENVHDQQGNLPLNRGRKRIVGIAFNKNVKQTEDVITHEMIHGRKYNEHTRHLEKKIDFETIGRITYPGFKNIEFGVGYYYNDPRVIKRKGLSNLEKANIISAEMESDREMLTGNIKKQLIGKPLVKQVDKLYPKSYFYRDIEPIIKQKKKPRTFNIIPK